MFGFALAVVIGSLIFYLLFAAAIVFHLKEYSIPGDKNKLILNIFLSGSAILIATVIWFFLRVPWEHFL